MLSALYLFIFAAASRWYTYSFRVEKSSEIARIAVLIPCYQHDTLILRNASALFKQDYPKDRFEVIVLGDELHAETALQLEADGIRFIPIELIERSKAGALNQGMAQIRDDFDIAFILDCDNQLESNVLHVLNAYYQQGFKAIQGHRTALNHTTDFAILDGWSEAINNAIFRMGHRALGFSSALIGSGMAFDYRLFKTLMGKISAFGEDKELEFALLKRRIKIAFAHEALIYDEKVESASGMYQQRRRWIAAQIESAKNNGKDFWTELRKGNWDFIDKYVQMLLPPRILLLGILVMIQLVFLSAGIFLAKGFVAPGPSYMGWLFALLICLVAFALATPKQFYRFRTFLALFRLPLGFGIMFVGLLRYKKGYRSFRPTRHKGE